MNTRRIVGPRLGPFLAIGLLVAAAARADEPSRAALLAFAREPLTFESFCFSGNQFPACRFEHPEQVERLVGPTTLQTTWYDADSRVVTAPKKDAGRYAAVVEIRRPGRVGKRFFTLYHLPGNARPGVRASDASLTLPSGAGIDPDVTQSQSEEIDDFAA